MRSGHLILMFEMPDAGGYHTDSFFIGHIDRFLILDRSPRLQYHDNSCIGSNFNAIREGKESIRSHNTSRDLKMKCFCFNDSLLQSINTGGLPNTAGN